MTSRERIYDLASSILGVPKNDLNPDAPFEQFAGDSLELVEFVFAVQEELGVTFDTSEFDGLKSLNDLVSAVESKLSVGRSS